MTTQKDLKRVVRARMKKTGESYTSARAQVIRKPKLQSVKPAKPVAALSEPAVAEYATIAGMSDDVVKEKTGCTWERWVYALDAKGADQLTHREIADLIHTKYKVGPWWTQMVAVGYERIKGLRGKNQRRDGTFEATKSKTFNVDVDTLYDAWAKAATRKKWLAEPVKVRTATAPKSMRLEWPDGGIVAVGFYPKGNGKSSVAVQHAKLPDREAATRMKESWAQRLDALKEVLS
jgi:uncharacterized protein YndB with AHSA1/START domain